MSKKAEAIQIDEEFAAWLMPLSQAEYQQLEENILAEGCREPLLLWGNVLIDGHNRLKICQQHNIAFKTTQKAFHSREEAKDWIIKNQLGRRNITSEARDYLIGKLYQEQKKQGIRNDLTYDQNDQKLRNKSYPEKQSGQNDHKLTSEKIANQYKLSAPTVRRAQEFAEAVDTISTNLGSEVKDQILSRELNVTKEGVKALANKPIEEQKVVIEKLRNGEAKSLQDATRKVRTEKQIALINKAPQPTGQYRVLVIDPAWPYEFRDEDDSHRGKMPYPKMSIEEIQALKVPELSYEDAVLWLWTTNSFTHEAFHVIEQWGFIFKTLLTWTKSRIGLGNYLRNQTEHCLMAIKGKPTLILNKQSTWINAPAREHSRKPDEFYELVDSLCPGNKCELFAREQRKGWTCFGAEIGVLT